MSKKGYLPPDQRANMLLISDDIRAFSGVAHIARELVLNTCHHYNWNQIAGSITTPDKGKQFDISQDINKEAGISDSKVIINPVEGYGSPSLIRNFITTQKIDALFIITDPRYFTWLFQIENEIRKHIPIIYLSIWDELPAPHYNCEYYESCDLLLGISKQTHNIHQMVLSQGNIPYKVL